MNGFISRAVLEDIRKNIVEELSQVRSDQLGVSDKESIRLGGKQQGLQYAIDLIDKYEKEVIDLLYPKEGK